MTAVKVTAISIKKGCEIVQFLQRANIKCLVKLKKKFVETYELVKKVCSDDYMSRTQVYTRV